MESNKLGFLGLDRMVAYMATQLQLQANLLVVSLLFAGTISREQRIELAESFK